MNTLSEVIGNTVPCFIGCSYLYKVFSQDTSFQEKRGLNWSNGKQILLERWQETLWERDERGLASSLSVCPVIINVAEPLGGSKFISTQ